MKKKIDKEVVYSSCFLLFFLLLAMFSWILKDDFQYFHITLILSGSADVLRSLEIFTVKDANRVRVFSMVFICISLYQFFSDKI